MELQEFESRFDLTKTSSNMENKEKPKIKTYNCGFFSINICQNCFSYEFNHHPNLVFHVIDSMYLKFHQRPILTPKGIPDAPFYYRYFGRRFLHLGPLYITGPLQQKNGPIWFGFDLNTIKDRYPDVKYLNRIAWEHLSWHANSLSPDEETNMRERLFLTDYFMNPPTGILLSEQLDCSLAKCTIVRTHQNVVSAQQFSGKTLESAVLDLDQVKKISGDYFNHLHHSNETWQKFFHEPGYKFPECGCGIH